MKILVAEDDACNRLYVVRIVTKLGHEAVEANDGIEADALLRVNGGYDVAILDWMMPKRDGLGVLKSITKDERGRPYIIMATAKAYLKDEAEAMSLGADDYLTKPFEMHDLEVKLLLAEKTIKWEGKP